MNSIRKTIPLWLTFYCSMLITSSFGQEDRSIGIMDSLRLVIAKMPSDSLKVNTLNLLIKNLFLKGNFNDAYMYCQQSIQLAKKINFQSGEAQTYNQMGINENIAGNYQKSLNYHFEALKLRKNINDKKGIAGSLNNIGMVYQNIGEMNKALNNFNEALKINLSQKNDAWAAKNYQNIGFIYFKYGNYHLAMKHTLKARALVEKIADFTMVAECYKFLGLISAKQNDFNEANKYFDLALKFFIENKFNHGIGDVYVNKGNLYYQKSDYNNALLNFQNACKNYEEMNNQLMIGQTLANIGSCYFSIGDIKEAIKYFDRSFQISSQLEDKSGLVTCYMNYGEFYSHTGNLIKANQNLNNALNLALELNDKDAIVDCYKGLAKLSEITKNWQKANEYNKMYMLFKDSLFNNELTRKLTRNIMQYEFDKKESEIKLEQEKKDAIALKELQRQKLVRNSFMGGFTLVSLFAGVFFMQRNKIKKGKKRSDELLLNILPEEVAEELKAKGSAEAQLIDEVTVLFTDFKGFTQLSEKLTPKELVAEINECFSAFDYIMEQYGVEKIKTIGDAYMAAGGLPTANNTHAVDVVKAALAIQQFMQQHKAKKQALGQLFFEIRIGVHTGPVVAGIVGVKKFAYDIWGDTVNTASRMESSGEVGKVNISGTTYELVKDKFNCVHRGKVQAKGKGEIDMYFVSQI